MIRIAGMTALVAVVVVPLSAGAESMARILGTAENPELVDPPNDVNYNPAYPGARDHDWLDVVAAWFGFDAAQDKIQFTLRNRDATRLSSAATGFEFACMLRGNVTLGGVFMGRLYYNLTKPVNSATVSSTVYWGETSTAASYAGRVLRHDFHANLDAPADFQFAVDREMLLNFGDEIQNMQGYCVDRTPTPPSDPRILIDPNGDNAFSKASYSFVEHRRLSGPDGALDPIEEFERTNTTAPASTSPTMIDERTSAIGVLSIVAILVTSAFLRRKHQ